MFGFLLSLFFLYPLTLQASTEGAPFVSEAFSFGPVQTLEVEVGSDPERVAFESFVSACKTSVNAIPELFMRGEDDNIALGLKPEIDVIDTEDLLRQLFDMKTREIEALRAAWQWSAEERESAEQLCHAFFDEVVMQGFRDLFEEIIEDARAAESP